MQKKLKCNFFVSEEVEVYPMTFLHQIKLFQFLTKILFQLSPLFLHQEPESPNQIFFGFGDVGQITIPKNQIGQIYEFWMEFWIIDILLSGLKVTAHKTVKWFDHTSLESSKMFLI